MGSKSSGFRTDEKIPKKISVGVCAYNEELNIGPLLESLSHQEFRRFEGLTEVLIVASGCRDHTEQIVREYSRRNPIVKLISEPRRNGKAIAINRILSEFTGDLLVLIAADVVPGSDSLEKLLCELMSDTRAGVVSGHPVPVNEEEGFIGYLVHLMWRLHHRTLKYLSELGLCTHATGELMALKRNVVDRIPENVINDDAFISVQAWKKGYAVRYCSQAIVFIQAPTNILDYFTQRRRVLYGHYMTKIVTGFHSRTLESMLAYDPSTVFTILGQELVERPKSLLSFPVSLLLEILAVFLAFSDIVLHNNRDRLLWGEVLSTKSPASKIDMRVYGKHAPQTSL